MVTYVLTLPTNAVSAVRLGYPVVHEDNPSLRGARVIRWGNSIAPESRNWAVVLNKKTVLQTSVNKQAALEALGRQVKTPFLYNEGDTVPRGKKAVVRGANHSAGEGFEVVNGPYYVNDGEHATEFIPDTREYRVWFVRDKMMCAKRIPRPSQGQTAADQCRSAWGYSFCSEVFPKLKVEAKKARLAIPLDFGAMDVLWKEGANGEEGKYYFLEINSAPSLDHDRVLEFFKSGISEILGPETSVTPTPAPRSQELTPPPRTVSPVESLRQQIAAKAKADYDRMYNEELTRLMR